MVSILDLRDLGANTNVMIATLTLVVITLYRSYHRPRTTKFRGPPSTSSLFGVTKDHFYSPDVGRMYGNWEKTYGPVYEVPSGLGSTILIVQDPKAITDLFTKDTTTYHQSKLTKALIKIVFGVSSSDGSYKAILSRSFDGRLTM